MSATAALVLGLAADAVLITIWLAAEAWDERRKHAAATPDPVDAHDDQAIRIADDASDQDFRRWEADRWNDKNVKENNS